MTRPPSPLPAICAGSMPRSSASRRTAGLSRRERVQSDGAAVAGAPTAAAGSAAGAAGTVVSASTPASSMTPISVPIGMVVPSGTEILTSVPSKGEGISKNEPRIITDGGIPNI